MTEKAFYNLTHDGNGNAFSWIVATEKDNGKGKKPDLTIWARGYTVERLHAFADYLKGSARDYAAFLLIEAKTGKTCRLLDYMEKVKGGASHA